LKYSVKHQRKDRITLHCTVSNFPIRMVASRRLAYRIKRNRINVPLTRGLSEWAFMYTNINAQRYIIIRILLEHHGFLRGRYDMIWYDMIWYDMIYDMTWHDMTWHDMTWHMLWYDMIYDIVMNVNYEHMYMQESLVEFGNFNNCTFRILFWNRVLKQSQLD
jgi:hypothetical protein